MIVTDGRSISDLYDLQMKGLKRHPAPGIQDPLEPTLLEPH